MINSTQEFYDNLAENYQLIAKDWDSAVLSQGEVLHSLITKHFIRTTGVKILDCSCGIGTQAIGLALKGYKVHATDLSPKAVEKAKSQAKRLKADLTFGVADFRTLDRDVEENFDVVISCDNSLPHLLTDDELKVSSSNIFQKLKPGGLFLASIRDYDELLKSKPTGMIPRRIQDETGERIYTQAWTWIHDKNEYEVELFLILKSASGWVTHSYKSQYRALQRDELSSFLSKAGFNSIEWHSPEESGYYQPVVSAVRPKGKSEL